MWNVPLPRVKIGDRNANNLLLSTVCLLQFGLDSLVVQGHRSVCSFLVWGVRAARVWMSSWLFELHMRWMSAHSAHKHNVNGVWICKTWPHNELSTSSWFKSDVAPVYSDLSVAGEVGVVGFGVGQLEDSRWDDHVPYTGAHVPDGTVMLT